MRQREKLFRSGVWGPGVGVSQKADFCASKPSDVCRNKGVLREGISVD